jgi:hypothetical protein
VLTTTHASERHNSLGPRSRTNTSCSRKAGRCGHSSGATGAGFGLALPVDGPPEMAPNCEASIPKAKATEGERIRTSRLQPGESQSGATWNVEAGDIAGPSVGFSGISMLSAEEGWAVGSESNNSPAGPTGSDTVPVYTRPLLLHYQQGTWTRLPADPQLDNVQLSSISMRSSDDGWAVGNAIGGSIAPVVLRYSGGQWRRLATAFPGGSLVSISAAGPGEAWAVGYGGPVSGIALHCMRDACTRVEMPTPNILSAVAMRSPTDGWIGGHGAVTLHFDGHQWTKAGLVIHGEVLTGLAMQSATEGWAVGDPFSTDYGTPLLRCHDGVWQPEELHLRLP